MYSTHAQVWGLYYPPTPPNGQNEVFLFKSEIEFRQQAKMAAEWLCLPECRLTVLILQFKKNNWVSGEGQVDVTCDIVESKN